ncbi:NADH-quinone oxidoreductase subunit NuoH [Deltaproteobacteria bacterium PRO3]|nr:NADH-quinone oxidoreductase subunit NuoH [Deltaproteobacteria bacterium PRO3]
MEQLATYLHENYLYGAPLWVVQALVQFGIAAVVLMLFVSPFAGILSFIERRIAGRMQDRIGPNRVGPQGILQFLADGIKSLLKEDLIPKDADKPLFVIAPYLVFLGMFTTFVALPFASKLIVADLNVGILYIFATSSLTVVGLVMAGWGSGSKWSMLGGMRAAAQVISYEIPAGLAALTVLLLAGSLSMQTIISRQGPHPWQWFLFDNPFCLIAFFILFTALVAEGNRAPFDLPEAESELVSGYNTEYSGMRFVFFFFAEWANLYVMAAILTTLFLGGWQIPASLAAATGSVGVWLTQVVQLLFFQIKCLVIIFLVIQLRWTLPRIRMDQLMSLCWKYLVPIGFVCVIGTAIWMMLFPQGAPMMRYLLTALAAVITVYYFYRVLWQIRVSRAEVQLNPFV